MFYWLHFFFSSTFLLVVGPASWKDRLITPRSSLRNGALPCVDEVWKRILDVLAGRCYCWLAWSLTCVKMAIVKAWRSVRLRMWSRLLLRVHIRVLSRALPMKPACNTYFTSASPGLRRNVATRRARWWWATPGRISRSTTRTPRRAHQVPWATPMWRLISLASCRWHASHRSTIVSWTSARFSTPRAWKGTFRPSRRTQSFISSWVGRTKLANSGARYLCKRPFFSPFSWSCQLNSCLQPCEAVSPPAWIGSRSVAWTGREGESSTTDAVGHDRVEGLLKLTQGFLSGRSRRSVTTWTTPIKSASTTLRQRHELSWSCRSNTSILPHGSGLVAQWVGDARDFTTCGREAGRLTAEEKGNQMIRDRVEAKRNLKIRFLFVQWSSHQARTWEICWFLPSFWFSGTSWDSGLGGIGRECAKLPLPMQLDAIARVDWLLKLSQRPSELKQPSPGDDVDDDVGGECGQCRNDGSSPGLISEEVCTHGASSVQQRGRAKPPCNPFSWCVSFVGRWTWSDKCEQR